MKGTWIRWIAAVLMLIGLSLLVSSPSIAETKKASNSLPLDMKVPGKPPKKNGWNKDFTKYKDSTIEMSVEKSSLTPTEQLRKRKNSALETLIIRVKIKDPSQIRTAMSKDTYTGSERVEAEVMAKAKNAVLAINGDFFKYHQTWGYVVRQGVFYRDKTDSKYKIDMLAIDSQGDFHIVQDANTKKIEKFTKELPKGVSLVNTFNWGPVLIQDGKVQSIKDSAVAHRTSFDFQWDRAQQRICIAQTGPLEYAIVEVYGRTDGSMGTTLQEFADYVKKAVPDAIIAYNLDGGGSTNVVVNNKRICKTPGHREITDIIYFASAED